MSVPFKGPTSPPWEWSLFLWKHTLGERRLWAPLVLALWRLWALCVGDLFTGLVMLFRCWFLFLFVLIHRSSHASTFVSERWGLKYVERRPLSIRGRCEHISSQPIIRLTGVPKGEGEGRKWVLNNWTFLLFLHVKYRSSCRSLGDHGLQICTRPLNCAY